MKKEIKAGMGYTIGNILIKGITFITLPIFSRILLPEEFGIYNTYMAYEALLSILLGLGMYSSIRNAKIDFPDKLNDFVSTLIRITLIPLIFFALLILLFPQTLSGIIGLTQPLLFLLLLQSYGAAMLSISNSRLAQDYNYKKYMVFAAVNTIGNIGLSILLIKTLFQTSREYGRIIGSAIPLIGIGIYIFTYYVRRGRYEKNMAVYAVKYGLPLIWHYLSQQVQNQFDRIAITNLTNAAFTGIYSFAYSIANILQVVFYSTENVWNVWFFGKMSEEKYDEIREASKKYVLLIASLAVFMLFGSKEVITIMGDVKYHDGIRIFIPILIGIFLLFLYTVPVGIEYYFKETKYIALTTGISAAVNVILNYLFIPRYGYMAAAYTTMFSYAVQFSGHWFISKKILKKHNIKQVYSLSYLLKILLFVILSGVFVHFSNPYPVLKYAVLVIIMTYIFFKNKNDIISALSAIIEKKIKKA